MNDHDEQFIPEPATEHIDQSHTHNTLHSMHGFIYDQVHENDIPSLDRVWDNVTQHVLQHKAVYLKNKHLREYQKEHKHALVHTNREHAYARHKRRGMPSLLTNIAAILLIALLLGSWMFVVNSVHQQGEKPGVLQHGTPTPPIDLSGVSGKITIIQSGQRDDFDHREIAVPVGVPVLWTNQTQEMQVIIGESDVAVPPHLLVNQTYKQIFERVGTYTFHLQHALDALIRISIVAPDEVNKTIIINPATGEQSSQFFPALLEVKPGAIVMWKNETVETQVVICDCKNIAPITLKPKATMIVLFDHSDTFYFHLQSNPQALILVRA